MKIEEQYSAQSTIIPYSAQVISKIFDFFFNFSAKVSMSCCLRKKCIHMGINVLILHRFRWALVHGLSLCSYHKLMRQIFGSRWSELS